MSEIFVDGRDTGYRQNSKWWWDENSVDGFRISELDEDYPQVYFKSDHVSAKVVNDYCDNVVRWYELFTRKELNSIAEFGSGGGWFTEEFKNRGYEIIGFEGSTDGIGKCIQRGLHQVKRCDIRKGIKIPISKYDIVLCTEVAGHIEPPFASMLVINLTNYSDIIWWSSEEPNANEPHLHHPNEQPYKFWVNLFNFYGYSHILLSDEIFNACERRGRCIFYNRLKFPPDKYEKS